MYYQLLITITLFALCGMACLALGTSSPTPSDDQCIHIAAFNGNRAAAISFTFDDSLTEHLTLAMPMLEKYGFRGTFGVIAGNVQDTGLAGWEQWRLAAQRGHEIADHSWSHPDLTKLDDATLEKEVNGAYRLIAEKIGVAPFTFIYPFNALDARVHSAVYQHHYASRDNQEFYGGLDYTTAMANQAVEKAIQGHTWIVPMIHGIEHEGYMPFASRQILDDHLRYVKSRENDIWVDTFGHVARYVRERDAAQLAISSFTLGKAVFTFTCPLDGKIYDMPLTIVIPAAKARNVHARQQGTSAPLPCTTRDSAILVDVVPSSTAPITVTWDK